MKLLIVFLAAVFISIPYNLYAADENNNKSPNRLILSIGISSFGDPYWKDLKYPEKDASKILNFMNKEASPNFTWSKLLTQETSKNKGVSKMDIISSMIQLKKANISENDIVIVYVSTHGTIDRDENGTISRYMVTSDTNSRDIAKTGLKYDSFLKLFRSLKSQKKALILDYCHSGTGKSKLTADMWLELESRKGEYFPDIEDDTIKGEYILAASKYGQTAQESEAVGQSVYTHFLLEGFHKDLNSDGAVSLTEAHSHARMATHKFTSGNQTPTQSISIEGSDPIYLVGSKRKKSMSQAYLFSFWNKFANYNVSINGKSKGTLKGGLTVPEGKVRLKLINPETKKVIIDRVINFENGLEYSIGQFLFPNYSNTIAPGFTTFDILTPKVRKNYAKRYMKGVSLKYKRDEAVGIYDLAVELKYFAPQKDHYKITDDQSYSKRRTLTTLSVLGIHKNKVESLSSKSNTIKSEFQWSFGPSGLYIKEKNSENSFYRKNASYTSLGLVFGAGLDFLLVKNRIKFGVDIQFGAYQNFTDENAPFIVTNSITFYALGIVF